jgi:regulator of nonsense transcripts 2
MIDVSHAQLADWQMSNDPAFINLPLLATFLKYFERAYLGGAEVAGDAGDTSGDLPAGVDELVPAEERKTMRSLFVSYFNSASKTLVKGQVVSPNSLYF